MITFVTAFYVPPTSYRSIDTYFSKFEEMVSTGISILLFLDQTLKEKGDLLQTKYPNLHIEYTSLERPYDGVDLTLPLFRNSAKDTTDYFYIQLSKLRHLSYASHIVDTSHLAWIDFGIFHMFHDIYRAQQLLKEISVEKWPLDQVWSPGCWPYNSEKIFISDKTLWFHCGSFMLGDRRLFTGLYEKQQECVQQHLPIITWEVNYWAVMDGFTFYSADHNESILSNILNLNIEKNNEKMLVLNQLANHSRTDKNTIHSYMPIYEKLFESKRYTAKNVVEIGIGICPKGGGSIKLWHDYFENAHIYGMDVQELHMFWDELKNKERITLFTSTNAYDDTFVDKTFFEQDKKLDIIIDDGAHTLETMISFITLYSQALADKGVMVIEDIQDIGWIDVLRRYVPRHLKPYVEVYDLRHVKGRYDDIMFVINTNKEL